MQATCFECGQKAEHAHHVVPKSQGGKKTVPLCLDCHGKVHGKKMVASSLVKAALAARKARGLPMGGQIPACNNLTPESRAKGLKAAWAGARQAADSAYSDLLPVLRQHRQDGMTLVQLASWLTEQGYRTRRGGSWSATQVMRVLDRQPA